MNDTSNEHADAGRPRSTRLRKIAYVCGAVLLGAALFVVMLPTTISWGLFRGAITGQVQGSVNGTASIGGLDVSWGGPIVLRQLRIEDPPNHTSVDLTLQLDQGLWSLITQGVTSLSGSVQGAVKTQMDAEGNLGITKMFQVSESASGAASKTGSGSTKSSAPFPERVNWKLAIGPMDMVVDGPDGKPYASVRKLQGTVALVAGGAASVDLKGDAFYQGTQGQFAVAVKADSLVDAAGNVRFKGTPLDVQASAEKLAFSAGGVGVMLESATAKVNAKDMTGPADVLLQAKGAVQGSQPSSLDVQLQLARLLTDTGWPAVDLAGVQGRVVGTNVPTAPLQQLLGHSPLVLARDVGPTVDINASFANATGSGIKATVRSQHVQLDAEGSVNTTTRQATLGRVAVAADLAPELMAAHGLQMTGPGKMTLNATDVVVPPADATGALPVGALAFKANAVLALPGAAVKVGDQMKPLGIAALQLTASAAPVDKGVTFDLSASTASGGAAGQPLRVAGTLTPGGAFGVTGQVQAQAVPTALVDPWLPEMARIRATEDFGPQITRAMLEIGAGAPAPLKVELDSPGAVLRAQGTRAANGALQVSTVTMDVPALQPARLAAMGLQGVDVDVPLHLQVSATDVQLPPPDAFSMHAVRGTMKARVTPAKDQEIELGFGTGQGARSVLVRSVDLEAGTTDAAGAYRMRLQTQLDGSPVDIAGTVSGLFDAQGALALEAALFDATAAVGPVKTAQIVDEVPALARIGPALLPAEGARVQVQLKGSLKAGQVVADLSGGQFRTAIKGALAADSLTVDVDGTVPVTQALLEAVAHDELGKLGAPATATLAMHSVRVPRSGLWNFGPPAEARVMLKVPALTVSGVDGLAVPAQLSETTLDATIGLAEPASAKGTLKTAVTAAPQQGAAQAVAGVDAQFQWQAGQSWSADLALANINGAGLEELLGVPADSRGQIGSGGSATLRARQNTDGTLAFEAQSQVERLKVNLKGDLKDDVLTLQPSQVDLDLPGPSVVSLLNDRNTDNKETWRSSTPLRLHASVQQLRMRLHRLNEGAAAAPATVSLRLPQGFAALVDVQLESITLTPKEGQPVTVQGAAFKVDAPGIGKPATVQGKVELSGKGADGKAQVAAATLNGQLREWTRADGAVAFDTMQLDGSAKVDKASTALLGALLGMGNELEEALGPDVTLTADVKSTGPGAANGTAQVDSKFLTMRAPSVRMDKGFLLVDTAKPLEVNFIPSVPLKKRVLEPINPIFTDVSLADEKKPIQLLVSSVRYPMDGNYHNLEADLKLTVGNVLLQRNQQNQLLNMLKIWQSTEQKPVEGLIDPLVVAVRRGQLTYENFNVFVEKQGNNWVTKLIFSGDIDLTRTPPQARSIAANYPMGSLARQMLSNVPAEDGGNELAGVFGLASGAIDMVQLRITFSGPLGEVDGKPAQLKRKIKVQFKPGAAGENIGKTLEGIGSAIGGIFGGGNNNQSGDQADTPKRKKKKK